MSIGSPVALLVRCMVFCACASAGLAGAQRVGMPASGSNYTVKPGDTLWEISREHLGRPLLWPDVQQRNGVGEPRLLQVGQVLHFDDDERQAVVEAARGDVRLGEGAGSAHPLMPGTRVPERSVVRTGPDSFVTLRLPDGSRTTLPSNSAVRLVHYFDDTGRPAVLLDLQAGDVESRVPRREKPPAADAWRVRTRMATVGVRGTHFRVSLPDTANMAVSVLESTVVVDDPARAAQRVPAGKGVLAGSAPSAGQVQDLLPAPAWVNPGQAQNQPGVQLAWNSVVGAGSYHAQLARDAEFLDLVAEQRVPAGMGLEMALFEGIASGSYFARVAAVTPDGVEGLVSESAFSRDHASLGGQVRRLADSGEIEFRWSPVQGATYRLEVADDPDFRRPVVRADGLLGVHVRVEALAPGQYWWRVTADVVDQGQRAEVQSPARPLLVEGIR